MPPPAGPWDKLRIGFVSHQHDITDLFGQLEIGFREGLDAEGIEYDLFQAAPSASSISPERGAQLRGSKGAASC